MTENNTAPDGLAEFLQNHTGPEYGWLGPWNHVRGAEMEGNKLAMGRKGFYEELMSFYDQYLAGIAPKKKFAPFAIQSVTTGKWRPEKEWPPTDVQRVTTELASGSYTDTGQSTRNSNTGVWTVSKPLAHAVHMAGAAQVKVDVSSATPRSNLVVDLYDLDASGKGPLVARQGSLIRNNGTVTLNLMSADWKFATGRRIGIRVTDNNSDWWAAAVPTNQTVQVYGGEITLPLLKYNRTQTIQGDSGTQRSAWMANMATAPAAAVTAARDFDLGVPMLAQPAEMKAELDSLE
jgi:predicted acyl esterase